LEPGGNQSIAGSTVSASKGQEIQLILQEQDVIDVVDDDDDDDEARKFCKT